MTKILEKSDKFCMTKSPFEKKSDKFYKWSDKKSQINFINGQNKKKVR